MTGNLPPAPQGTDGQWSPDRSWAAGDALLTQPLDLTVVQAVVEPPASTQAPRPSRLGVGLAVLGALLALWPAWETVGLVRQSLGDGGDARYAVSGGLNVLFVVIGCVAAVLVALALLPGRAGRGRSLGTLLLGVAVVGVVVAVVLDGGVNVASGQPVSYTVGVELGWDSFYRVLTWWVVVANVSLAVWAVAFAVLVSSGSRTPRHAPGGAPDA